MSYPRATHKSRRLSVVELCNRHGVCQTDSGELILVPLAELEFDAPISLLAWVQSDAWANGVTFEAYSASIKKAA